MPHKYHISALSPEVFAELKEISIAEYGDTMSDDEIREMGIRVLELFALLLEPSPKKVPIENLTEVTGQEFKALKYLHHVIYHDHTLPSVRDISKALGHRSSRSGFRMLHHLLDRGLVCRDGAGEL